MSKSKKKIIVFTDGSCALNGRKIAYGGIGIYFPNRELSNISKVYRHGYCTNQKTELYAILTALRYIKQNLGLKDVKVYVKTDSEYSINCITKWACNWVKNNWKKKNGEPVLNREFIETIYKYYISYDIKIEYVEAHTGLDDFNSHGNAKADELATRATKKAMLTIQSNSKTNESSTKKPTIFKNNAPNYNFLKNSDFVVELQE